MVDDWMQRHDFGREISDGEDMTKDAEPVIHIAPARKSSESKQQGGQEERPDDEEEICDNDWSTISTRSSFHLPSVPNGLLDLNFETDVEMESSPEVARVIALPA
ncbi:hypothetical protein BST61_g7028 [Cercospora zeina]